MSGSVVSEQPSRKREVRIYFSGHLQDLHDERKLLQTLVLPQLGNWCDQRGMTLVWIDFREGESEKKAEESVLKYGLYEIDRCRPFFVGVLGERYGLVPEAFLPEIGRAHRWLLQFPEASTLELEMSHAALRSPDHKEGTMFFFRDPSFVSGIPEEFRKRHEEHPTEQESESLPGKEARRRADERKKKIQDLKNRIRWAGLPVHDYAKPEDFAARLVEELVKKLERSFPDLQRPTPVQQANLVQAQISERMATGFLSRNQAGKTLESFMKSATPTLLIHGEPGSGKSALLAAWSSELQRRFPETPVIFHSSQIFSNSREKPFAIRRIAQTIKEAFRIQRETPDFLPNLTTDFRQWLDQASRKNGCWLIIDGLDEFGEMPQNLDLLSFIRDLPPKVRVIASVQSPTVNDFIRSFGWTIHHLSPWETEERSEFTRTFLEKHGMEIDSSGLHDLISLPSTGNPLFLSLVLEEFRLSGRPWAHEEGTGLLHCSSPSQLIEKLIEPVRSLPIWPLAEETLLLLSLSDRGFTQAELLHLLGTAEKPLSLSAWFDIATTLGPVISDFSGLYNISFPMVKKVFLRNAFSHEAKQKELRERIIGYFLERGPGTRFYEELPPQLARNQSWDKLHILLTAPEYFPGLYNHDPLAFQLWWAILENHSSFRLRTSFSALFRAPDRNLEAIGLASFILTRAGHIEETIAVKSALINFFKEKGEVLYLVKVLSEQAQLLFECRKPHESLALLKDTEALARETGDVTTLESVLWLQAEVNQQLGLLDSAILSLKDLLGMARELSMESTLCRTLGKIGEIYFQKGDLESSLVIFQDMEKLCREQSKNEGLAEALIGQSFVFRAWGDFEGAITRLREAENLCRQVNYKRGLEEVLMNIAAIFRTRGDWATALHLLREAEQICRETGDNDCLQIALGGQAQISKARGDLDTAMTLFRQQEALCRDIGKREGLQIALGGRAVILKDRGWLDEAITLAAEAEEICREIDYKEGLQRILGTHGMILKDKGDLDGALALIREAESICRELNLKSGLQRNLEYLALVLKARGDLDGALALFQEQEKICRELGIKVGLQVALGNQAHIHYFRGYLDQAEILYKEQEKICRELGLKDRLHTALGGQALIFRARAEFDAAMLLLREQERICLELGLKSGLQISLYNQGIIHLTTGDLKTAMNLFKDQEKICRDCGYREGLQASLGSQAVIRRARGELAAAAILFKQQESICRESGYKEGLQVSLCGKASLLLAQGYPDEAMEALREGERICRDLNHKEGLQRILCSQSMVHQTRGNLPEAISTLKEAEKICRSLNYKSGLQRILENQAIILQERGEIINAMELLKQQEKICRESGIKAGLQASLGQQALILKAQNQLEEAMRLLKEQETLCQDLGLTAGMVKAMAHQAEIMAKQMNNPRDALFLVAKAFHIAREHGLTALAKQIKGILQSVRNRCIEEDPVWKDAGSLEVIQARLESRIPRPPMNDDLDETLNHLKDLERTCRETGQMKELGRSLEKQSQILRERGDFEGAVNLLKEGELIFRKLDNLPSLAECLTHQALILTLDLKVPASALPMIEEACKIVDRHRIEDSMKETIDLLKDLVLSKLN